MLFGCIPSCLTKQLLIKDQPVEKVSSFKYLGSLPFLMKNLPLTAMSILFTKKAQQILFLLKKLRNLALA